LASYSLSLLHFTSSKTRLGSCHSGVTYNHTAKYLRDGDKYGAVVVTRHYSGNGIHREQVGIRGTEGFDFERFDPRSTKAEQNATASESEESR